MIIPDIFSQQWTCVSVSGASGGIVSGDGRSRSLNCKDMHGAIGHFVQF